MMDRLTLRISNKDLEELYGTKDFYNALKEKIKDISSMMYDEGHPIFSELNYSKTNGLTVSFNHAIVPLILGLERKITVSPESQKTIREMVESVIEYRKSLKKKNY